ncbi:MAG: transglutaminase domain-containing protein [Bacteroidetes bacterium]|nr:transglutaminase domain-containing protein [Bacteroidota bacterium]
MAIKFTFRCVLISVAVLAGILDVYSADFEVSYKKGSFKADSLKSIVKNWTAEELWAQSVSRNLKLAYHEIVLDDKLLIESDAAALGSIRTEAWDTLERGVVIRKFLDLKVLPREQALITMLIYPMVPAGPLSGGKLEFRVNGNKPIVYELKHFWTSVTVPVSYLKKGKNQVELKVHHPDQKFRVPMALSTVAQSILGSSSSFAGNSLKSVDQGKTWKNAGSAANMAEYPIRLKVNAFDQRAWLQTPVINLAEQATEGVLFMPVEIKTSAIKPDTSRSAGAQWQTRIRTGNTHLPEAGGWTEWRLLSGTNLSNEKNHRFAQLEYSFGSNVDGTSPKLKGLNLQTSLQTLASNDKLIVTEVRNYPFVRSSFQFVHEDPGFPELQELRLQFNLDKVVAGAKTEWEKIKRLRAWTAGSWDWFLPNANLDDLLSWDARKILSGPVAKGNLSRRGGNCLQYAIVFAQACQSFGIPARIVNANYAIWGGHELVEVWSRDYGKWIMADPNFDSMFYDKKTGIPLNILELHQVFLETYYPDGEVIDRDSWSFEDRDRRANRIDPDQLPIAMEVGGKAFSGKINQDYVWWKVTPNSENSGYSGGYGFYNTAEVRWIPRSNWLSQKLPLPVTHGRTHWGWDGYYAWTDQQTPETPEHRYYVRRASDLYGSLCHVDLSAKYEGSGKLKLTMHTETPGFSHFSLMVNGVQMTEKSNSLLVDLADGKNTIEIKSLDVLGNQGAASILKINYFRAKS